MWGEWNILINMTEASDNVGESRGLYVIVYMDVAKCWRIETLLFDEQKWPDDEKTEKLVLRIWILIWEMYQRDWEKL